MNTSGAAWVGRLIGKPVSLTLLALRASCTVADLHAGLWRSSVVVNVERPHEPVVVDAGVSWVPEVATRLISHRRRPPSVRPRIPLAEVAEKRRELPVGLIPDVVRKVGSAEIDPDLSKNVLTENRTRKSLRPRV